MCRLFHNSPQSHRGTGDGSYPEPAATLVRALSMANLDILGFGAFEELCCFRFYFILSLIAYRLLFAVPLGCVFRGASYYDKVLFKSTAPLGVLVLLACYPADLRSCAAYRAKRRR